MSEKKVTVIIPTYKRSDFLTRAVDSVLNQTYENVEVIVVDDNNPNSKDRVNTENTMKKYLNNSLVKYIKHEKNMNGAAARNTGIKSAEGEYITFLDDDDFFLKNRIEELVTILEDNKSYNAAYTGIVRIRNKKIVGIHEANIEGNLQNLILKLYSFFRTGSNMFFRKSAVKEFDVDFLRHQDIEYMARYFRKNMIKAVNSFTVVKDESSRINSPNINLSLEMKELFIKKFQKDINSQKKPNEIIHKIYSDIYNICPKKHEKYSYIKEKVIEYGGINRKERILTSIKILFPSLRNLLEELKCSFSLKKIKKEQIKEIKKFIE